MPEVPSVHVDLGARGYDVRVAPDALSLLGPAARAASPLGRQVFLAHDANLPRDTVARASEPLTAAGFKLHSTPIVATERDKSLAQLESLLISISRTKLERAEPVVALGGGVTGDLAGFAAAVYRRGVPLIQCPTTLLSMVDASVGGKTGVNLSLGTTDLHKNAVGSFHQPAAVLIDTRTLHSLPDREFRSGFAECVKHALLAADFDDPALFEWTASSAARLLARDNATLSELILRNVRIKAKVVASDEREELPPSNGGRALLNLGHTFGHAIETLPQLSPTQIASDAPLTHGEAISLGLVAAAQGSVLLGHLDAAAVSAVRDLLRALGLPSAVQSLPDSAEIMGRMMHDKKVASGRLRLVLPYRGNRAKVCDTPPTQAVLGAIDSIRAV